MGIFMEKRYVTRYSVKEICDILELEVPESCRISPSSRTPLQAA